MKPRPSSNLTGSGWVKGLLASIPARHLSCEDRKKVSIADATEVSLGHHFVSQSLYKHMWDPTHEMIVGEVFQS